MKEKEVSREQLIKTRNKFFRAYAKVCHWNAPSLKAIEREIAKIIGAWPNSVGRMRLAFGHMAGENVEALKKHGRSCNPSAAQKLNYNCLLNPDPSRRRVRGHAGIVTQHQVVRMRKPILIVIPPNKKAKLVFRLTKVRAKNVYVVEVT